jgi:hypothetical protein
VLQQLDFNNPVHVRAWAIELVLHQAPNHMDAPRYALEIADCVLYGREGPPPARVQSPYDPFVSQIIEPLRPLYSETASVECGKLGDAG